MIVKFYNNERVRTLCMAVFSVVFISCAVVYFKTKKTLKKYEHEFLAELQLNIRRKKQSFRKL